ncbi:MAG: uracil-DNA glycosylase [Nitrososphaera sp.]
MRKLSLGKLNSQIIRCSLCPRLSDYIKKVGEEKVKRFEHEDYWARPLPSWGDPNARLLIVGLAPAAHGGNRTGRMFTGDSSGDWLMRAMYRTGFASMPTSSSKDDGLVLNDAYITAALKCAPPENKPTTLELANCSQYLLAELGVLQNVRVVLALSKIAFDAYCKAEKIRGTFRHGMRYTSRNGKTLIASYHPSRQNTNTGRLTWDMWLSVFRMVRSDLNR